MLPTKPLLTVDDFSARQTSCGVGSLLQHHCAQEMPGNSSVPFAASDPFQKAGNVFPQRFPLLLATPNIGSLEQGHCVANLMSENFTNGNVGWLHILEKSNQVFGVSGSGEGEHEDA
jgi:ubiquitin C-terminal hydrolase